MKNSILQLCSFLLHECCFTSLSLRPTSDTIRFTFAVFWNRLLYHNRTFVLIYDFIFAHFPILLCFTISLLFPILPFDFSPHPRLSLLFHLKILCSCSPSCSSRTTLSLLTNPLLPCSMYIHIRSTIYGQRTIRFDSTWLHFLLPFRECVLLDSPLSRHMARFEIGTFHDDETLSDRRNLIISNSLYFRAFCLHSDFYLIFKQIIFFVFLIASSWLQNFSFLLSFLPITIVYTFFLCFAANSISIISFRQAKYHFL